MCILNRISRFEYQSAFIILFQCHCPKCKESVGIWYNQTAVLHKEISRWKKMYVTRIINLWLLCSIFSKNNLISSYFYSKFWSGWLRQPNKDRLSININFKLRLEVSTQKYPFFGLYLSIPSIIRSPHTVHL